MALADPLRCLHTRQAFRRGYEAPEQIEQSERAATLRHVGRLVWCLGRSWFNSMPTPGGRGCKVHNPPASATKPPRGKIFNRALYPVFSEEESATMTSPDCTGGSGARPA